MFILQMAQDFQFMQKNVENGAFVRYNIEEIMCGGLVECLQQQKKEEKVNKVFDAMPDIHDMQEFKNIFMEMYPASNAKVRNLFE